MYTHASHKPVCKILACAHTDTHAHTHKSYIVILVRTSKFKLCTAKPPMRCHCSYCCWLPPLCVRSAPVSGVTHLQDLGRVGVCVCVCVCVYVCTLVVLISVCVCAHIRYRWCYAHTHTQTQQASSFIHQANKHTLHPHPCPHSSPPLEVDY